MIKKKQEIVLDSVPRKTLAKEVADRIIQLLASGQLKPGDKLYPETELTKMLSVSRPVLREAMSSLESLGIIHRKTRDGTYFSEKISSKPYTNMLSLAGDDLPSIIEARMALELGMIAMAAEKITDQQLDELNQTIKALSEHPGDYSQVDKEFHRIIAFSVNNYILEGMIDSLLMAFDRMSKNIQFRERDVAVEHHKAIYEALKKRSPSEAFAQMYRHLDYVRKKILKQRKESKA
ncbi:FadR/GntR family transcriptional regulator [Paenibacillus naphthalenovorans]|uniref:Transcriptional regulator NanR n=1 Tax=Paenibacillus naphthalenovorans TaxID=162209 RepID=A0A0U2MTC2_9BACL|nr:FadR/GntR family transcriptional regulator [Paenibacillus naphthalenovorans]ALS20415.1 transcriptional regulator NanR [Paenibacillus naphthalenovorans]GCL72985.1 FadR family transcriptional regulator [Paenibacillus naphthalenovorans]SDI70889.1 DNA-binding transcriptional regulator, FadR family [Paenibacillus naphthalenovorans]